MKAAKKAAKKKAVRRVRRSALGVAYDTTCGGEPNPFPGASSYYDSSLKVPPVWATDVAFVGEVASPHRNSLRFHNVDHDFEKEI